MVEVRMIIQSVRISAAWEDRSTLTAINSRRWVVIVTGTLEAARVLAAAQRVGVRPVVRGHRVHATDNSVAARTRKRSTGVVIECVAVEAAHIHACVVRAVAVRERTEVTRNGVGAACSKQAPWGSTCQASSGYEKGE